MSDTKPRFDREAFKKAIAQIESSGGKKLENENSSAAGAYHFLYRYIKNVPLLKGISKREFINRPDLQERIMDMAIDGSLPGFPSYEKRAYKLKSKYDTNLRPDEIAALTHYLGSGGVEQYLKDPEGFQVPGKVNATVTGYIGNYNEALGVDPSFVTNPKRNYIDASEFSTTPLDSSLEGMPQGLAQGMLPRGISNNFVESAPSEEVYSRPNPSFNEVDYEKSLEGVNKLDIDEPSSDKANKDLGVIPAKDNETMTEQGVRLSSFLEAKQSFAYGGSIDGSGYGDNKLVEFEGGGTHEENSLGGIPQGIGANGKLNTVEEDETKYVFDDGDYVFSNRIMLGENNALSGNKRNQFAEGGLMEDTDPKKKKKAKDERAGRKVEVDGTQVARRDRIKDLDLRTLEQQELDLSSEIPAEPSFLDNITNYVKDNVTEHIVNPLKETANEFLPESMQYDPSLKTVGTYDDTEGANKLLSETNSLRNMRKAKNVSFAQISEKGRKSNALIPEKVKERVVNATNPQGYSPDQNPNESNPLKRFEFFQRVMDEDSKHKQIKRLPGKRGDNREDIYRMYAGLPQKYDTFTASSFKAGKNSDTNVTFKDPEDVQSYLHMAALKTDLFDKLASGEINKNSIAEANKSGAKGGDKVHKSSFRDSNNVMWNATFGVGYDNSGNPYLSFYDNWDLALKDDNPVTGSAFGAPIEIYDRIPLTDTLIKKLAKVKAKFDKRDPSDKKGSGGADYEAQMESLAEEIAKDPKLKEEMDKVLAQLKRRMPKE